MYLRRFEESYLFAPKAEIKEDLSPFGLAEEVIDSPEGKLHLAYRLFPGSPALIVFAHGNTGNMSFFARHYRIYEKIPCSYLTFDYPGYGKSAGRPSEAGLYASLESALDFARDQLGSPMDQVILHGLSLGSAVALDVAVRRAPRGLIMESGFLSTLHMARHFFGPLPYRLLLRNKFVSCEKIAALRCPVLILHGSEDSVVPAAHSKALYELASEPKQIDITQGAAHSDQCEIDPERYLSNLKRFICRESLPEAHP